MDGVRVLVVGAGLAGLALARALRQAGIDAELIERQAGWDAGGTGIYLPANGVRALAALGLGDAVAAAAVRIPSQRLLTHRGGLLAEIGVGDIWGDGGACLALPRAQLHRMLRDGVPLRLGRTVQALEQVDGPVRVTFDDGSSGEYDLVPGLLDQLAPGEVHAAPIEEVAAERWGRGAVVLIGDAAHGMSPNMAQGASLAFEDALELVACLRPLLEPVGAPSSPPPG